MRPDRADVERVLEFTGGEVRARAELTDRREVDFLEKFFSPLAGPGGPRREVPPTRHRTLDRSDGVDAVALSSSDRITPCNEAINSCPPTADSRGSIDSSR